MGKYGIYKLNNRIFSSSVAGIVGLTKLDRETKRKFNRPGAIHPESWNYLFCEALYFLLLLAPTNLVFFEIAGKGCAVGCQYLPHSLILPSHQFIL